MKLLNKLLNFGGVAASLFILSSSAWVILSPSAWAATQEFKSVAMEYQGTKIWTPATFIVHKGDTVKFHLKSLIPAPGNVHGFAIDAYKISAVVDEKGKDIEFKADQEGIFPIYCQLHPGHIGGQLVVLK